MRARSCAIGLLVLAFPLSCPAPPLALGSLFHTESVTCHLNLGRVTDCKLNPGKTLDDSVQELWDLYVGNIQSGDEGEEPDADS